MEKSLEKIFNPGSVAVIGASEVPGKAAERRTRSLIEGGYQGEIYLINPKRSELFGRKAYPTIIDVNKQVDLVMVVVAPRFLTSAVADSIKMGAKGIIIITAGLGETGEEGKRIEAEMLEMASKAGANLIGPNCSGMFSASASMNLLGVPPLKKGGLSVIAQSGNVIDSLTHYAKMKETGFSKIISAGNAVGVKFHEYIDYLKDDPDTKAIMLYLEGIKEGSELVRVARETIKQKPIVALKVGRTGAGARASASHTGSLAGDDLIVDAAFRQVGITRVSNVDELFDMADVFSRSPLPKGNRVAILSEGGGDNSIAADNAEKYGIEVPILSKPTQEKMRPFLLEGMPTHNPIDYGGTAEENPHMITECCKVCMEDDQIDALFITGFFGGFKDIIASHVGKLEEQTSQELVELVQKYKKPLFVNTSFAREPIPSLEILKSHGIPVFDSSERIAQCLGALMEYAHNKGKIKGMKIPEGVPKPRPPVSAIFKGVREQGRNNLLETESRELLSGYGIKLPEARLARDPGEATRVAKEMGCPVAMKVVSPDIIHKSDAGGVKLGVEQHQVEGAFEEILKSAEKVTQRSRILGILISPMAPPGQECIVGMIRDRQFGPVLMFGLGGIFVEVMKDVSFRVAPLGKEDINEMVESIKGYRILTGIRGKTPKDINAIKDIIGKVSQMVIEHPEIQEIDLNPIIVHEKEASIVDSRVILTEILTR
ncbi:MAG: acetate--CoA ligase family protein [Thermodesulfobacteriota bacterium]|nr:acetate--CoA ligase family protein [Thermodesulfobacteriota bacterium]